MRTIRTKVMKFNELSNDAKERAIDDYRNEDFDDVWAGERNDSYKAAKEVYDELKGIEGEIYGTRLYSWLVNNIVSRYTVANYISKHEDGKFKNSYFAYKYDKCIKYRKSKVFFTNNFENCPLTGVCYDNDFLQPIYDFLKKPDARVSNINLSEEMPDYSYIADRDYEFQTSDEYITEHFEANEYEFTKDGRRF